MSTSCVVPFAKRPLPMMEDVYESPFVVETNYLKTKKKVSFYLAERRETKKEKKGKWYTKSSFDLGAGLEARVRLLAVVKPNLQAGSLLNVNIRHFAFYKPGLNLFEFLYEITCSEPVTPEALEEFKKNLERNGLEPNQRKRLEAALNGRNLEYRTPNGRTNRFRFSSIGQKTASIHMIRINGNRTSMVEYCSRTYNYNLRCPYLPCICVNKSENTWVPMEFVYTENVAQKYMREIPWIPRRKMSHMSVYPPEIRKQIIQASLNTKDSGQMEKLGVSVDGGLLKVKGSLLPAPILQFGQGVIYRDDKHCGNWDLKQGASLKKIIGKNPIISISVAFLTPPEAQQRQVDDGWLLPVQNLIKVLENLGLTIAGPDVQTSIESPPEWDIIRWRMKRFKEKTDKKFGWTAVPLVIFVLPYRRVGKREPSSEIHMIYPMLKYISDVEMGVYSQVLMEKTYAAMDGEIGNSVTQSVALKILGKIGVTLFKIKRSPWEKITDTPTLILGIDVLYAGKRGPRRSPIAIAGIVGNLDISAMNYEASFRVYPVNQPLDISEEIRERILGFKKSTGHWPEHLVVYRQGSSEARFQNILAQDKESIRRAISGVNQPGFSPTLSYIALSRNNCTRFFPINEEDRSGKAGNLKPGSLVESSICSKTYFDFFLVSHQASQGTSRPTHYHVLYDEWNPNSIFWQKITYFLTYGSARCTKSISKPAPTMYAHLAAKRTKDYLDAYEKIWGEGLIGMTENEWLANLRRNLKKHGDLDGMVFA